MKALIEFSGFLGVSVAAHLVLWQGASEGPSASAGARGAAQITLAGGAQSLQALVSEWDRPPEILSEPVPVALPAPDEAAPRMEALQADLKPEPVARPVALSAPGEAPQRPEIALSLRPVIGTLPIPQAMPEPTDSAPDLNAPQPVAKPAVTARPAPPLAPGVAPVMPKVDFTSRLALAPQASPRPKLRPKLRPEMAKPVAKATPKPKSKPKNAAAKKTAAGTGGKTTAGKARNTTAGATKARNPSASQMARWGGSIRARVERRKRFPGGATGSGKVRLWLRVTTTGRLAGAGISRSSGNPAFDRAALSAVQRAALPRAPGSIAAGAYRFTLSMSFNR